MKKSLLFLILVIISCNSFSQPKNDFISGEIRNIKNNLPISGANIYFIKDSIKIGISTDSGGKFKINKSGVPNFNKIKITCIGYEDFTITNIQNYTFFMKEKAIDLESVVIRKKEKKMSLVESLFPYELIYQQMILQ
jgi:hypothetical protein